MTAPTDIPSAPPPDTVGPPPGGAPEAATAPTHTGAAKPPAGNKQPQSVVSTRPLWMRRLNSWLKKTPVNAYWLDMRHLDDAIRHLAPKASGVMLDIGVGERPYNALFSPHVKNYFGLEYPPVVFGNLNPDLWDYIHVVHGLIDIFGDGHVLPVRDACLDTVLSLEVLEHVPDPERCVAEMARVLKPGGTVLLTVPLVSPLHQLPYDFRRFTPAGLQELLERHGLEVDEIRSRGNVASTAGSVLSHYFLRHWAAKRRKHDGSVIMSRWRGLLTMPFVAATQMFFFVAEKFARDDALCLGYSVVAHKPSGPR